ncbi:MAG TPA: TonB-dependent receptor [Terriglobia bacterium]|nr:TonB-dependent receptor [Terriglobia bacterium]
MRFKCTMAMLGGLIFCASALAQVSTGSIVGTVRDPGGAVIPGAKVVATSLGTNETWNTVTGAQGGYVFTRLPIGRYSISVQASGFKMFIQSGVTLNVQSRVEVDARLELGAINQTVSVTGNVPQLQTQSADVGQVVNSRLVVDLPLNGRRYDQLALLTAGANETTPAFLPRAEGVFSMNGNSSTQNNFVLDGADNNSYTTNLQDQSAQSVQPAVDSLAEFKVQTRDYSVEYGRNAGAVINASLKSGTNQLHGDVYEFLRNASLDSNDFFLNRAGQNIPPYQQNQFGFTLGGPIRKGKTFFFVNWEGTRINQGTTLLSTVPTPLMHQGDFTELSPSPTSPSIQPLAQFSNCIQGGIVQASCIDPVASKIFALYPMPNTNLAQNGIPGGFVGNNYIASPTATHNSDEVGTRLDYRFRESDTLFGHFVMFDLRQNRPGIFTQTNLIADGTLDSTQGINDDRGTNVTLGWTHIFNPRTLNDLHATFDRSASHSKPATLGKIVDPSFGLNGIPNFGPSISGGLPELDISGFNQLGSPQWLPQSQFAQIWQFKDALTLIKNTHTILLGVEIRRDSDNFLDLCCNRGQMSFSGQYTGQGITDFLLGLPNADQLENLDVAHIYRNGRAAFVQDAWRVNSKLTINYGLRYEYSSPLFERQNHVTNFSPSLNNGQGGLFTTPSNASGTFQRTSVHPYYGGFAPRAGFAFKVTPKLVMRGGAGVYYENYYRYGSESQLALNPPLLTDASQTVSPSEAPGIFLKNGFPSNFLTPININNSAQVSQLFIRAIDSNLIPSQIYEGSYGFEYSPTTNLMFELNYVFNQARHLWALSNVNQSNLIHPGQPPVIPFPNFRQNLSLPPSQTFPTYIEWLDSGSNSNYNGLQFTIEKRMSRGLSFLTSYTWSKAMSQVSDFEAGLRGIQDRYHRNLEWGLWDNDTPQRLVNSLTYMLPFGAGEKYATSGTVGRILGHWQLNGIVTYSSGQPLAIGIPFDTSGTGAGNRPNCLATSGGFSPTINQWLNPAAYAMPATYFFGNCSPTPGPRAPGISTWDTSLFRNIQISETKYFQFRAEFFNTFNTPQFGSPNTTINQPSFGQISSLLLPPRQIQFALKFYF